MASVVFYQSISRKFMFKLTNNATKIWNCNAKPRKPINCYEQFMGNKRPHHFILHMNTQHIHFRVTKREITISRDGKTCGVFIAMCQAVKKAIHITIPAFCHPVHADGAVVGPWLSRAPSWHAFLNSDVAQRQGTS